jgi:hypothetical protein
MSTFDSYVLSDMSPPTEDDDVDSLPSVSSDVLSSETDSEYESDAQKEWERSLDQLQLLLTMVLVPFVGKYLGRKFAYWSVSYLSLFLPKIAQDRLWFELLTLGSCRLGAVHGVDA